jgi:hypothetical protein
MQMTLSGLAQYRLSTCIALKWCASILVFVTLTLSFRVGAFLIIRQKGAIFPLLGKGHYQLTFHLYQKMNGNADVSASSITDNILAGDADAHGTIGKRVMNGQSKSMWMGWTYRVHNTTDKAAVTTGTWQQDETPDGSAGHTVNGYTMSYKFT